MRNNTGGSAFPVTINNGLPLGGDLGMTLRDYFAAKAMQAFISSPLLRVELGEYATALNAYKVADAMLKAREA